MRNLYLILAMLVAFPAANSFGQDDTKTDDGPVGIFSTRAEYNQFMGGAKQAAYGPEGTPELKAMIPMLNDIALNKPMGWTAKEYNDTGSTLDLLSDAKVRADLEMVDGQYKELQQLNSAIQNRAAEQIRSLDFSNPKNLVVEIRRIRQDAQKEIGGMLLPHQTERLQQIRMQSQLRRRNLVEILTSDPLKSELEITQDQSVKLREAQNEIEADLQKEIAKLREKARDRLLSKLNPSQKKQVESMIGDAFEFSEPEKKASRKNAPVSRKKQTGK